MNNLTNKYFFTNLFLVRFLVLHFVIYFVFKMNDQWKSWFTDIEEECFDFCPLTFIIAPNLGQTASPSSLGRNFENQRDISKPFQGCLPRFCGLVCNVARYRFFFHLCQNKPSFLQKTPRSHETRTTQTARGGTTSAQ